MKQVIPPDACWAVLIMSLVLLVQGCNYPSLTKCQSYQIRGLFVIDVFFFFYVFCLFRILFWHSSTIWCLWQTDRNGEHAAKSPGLAIIGFGMHLECTERESWCKVNDVYKIHTWAQTSLLSGAACCELHCLSSCLECLWERVSLTKACFRDPLSKVLRP